MTRLTNSTRPMLKGKSPVVESELYDSGGARLSDDRSTLIGEFLQGEGEPSSSWVMLVMGFVSTMVFLILYGILFPSSDLPVISSVLPVFDGVFDSGIWFFILGAMIGVFAILGTMLTEATSE